MEQAAVAVPRDDRGRRGAGFGRSHGPHSAPLRPRHRERVKPVRSRLPLHGVGRKPCYVVGRADPARAQLVQARIQGPVSVFRHRERAQALANGADARHRIHQVRKLHQPRALPACVHLEDHQGATVPAGAGPADHALQDRGLLIPAAQLREGVNDQHPRVRVVQGARNVGRVVRRVHRRRRKLQAREHRADLVGRLLGSQPGSWTQGGS